jgi:hypothetical protein
LLRAVVRVIKTFRSCGAFQKETCGFMDRKRWVGWLIVITAIYALHQDLWFWLEARPLVFGFLPVGLAYHSAYCLMVSALMWALTRVAWPTNLEVQEDPHR